MNEQLTSKERSVAEIVRHSDLLLESGDEVLCLTPHEWQQIKAEIDRLRAHRNICVQHLRLGAEQIRRADQRLSPYYMDQAKLLRIAVILDSAAKNAMADEPPAHETPEQLVCRKCGSSDVMPWPTTQKASEQCTPCAEGMNSFTDPDTGKKMHARNGTVTICSTSTANEGQS